jgi:hypothetical protein
LGHAGAGPAGSDLFWTISSSSFLRNRRSRSPYRNLLKNKFKHYKIETGEGKGKSLRHIKREKENKTAQQDYNRFWIHKSKIKALFSYPY